MSNKLKTSKKGIDLIKRYEGFRANAYADPAHGWAVPTIGYGQTKGVKRGMKVDKETAEIWLKQDLVYREKWVNKLIEVPLAQEEFDALVSFAYNLGVGALKKSTLRKKLNQGDKQGAANEFLKWVYAGGKKLKGLVNRRNAERELFLSASEARTVFEEYPNEEEIAEVKNVMPAAVPGKDKKIPYYADPTYNEPTAIVDNQVIYESDAISRFFRRLFG